MKIFVLAPQEDWICDRLVKEWYSEFKDISTKNINEADVIWLLAGWCWNHIPIDILKNKKIIVTEHHIVPEKFSNEKYQNFLLRDQFVDCYHVPNEKTKNLLSQITKKRIEVISYWYNDKLWNPISQSESRKFLNLSNDNYYVGSFQRDTEGSDLKTPKLEKGPDLLCEYLIRNRNKMKNLHVLLAGFRRQYIINRLESEKIKYTLFEKTDIETIKMLYAACNLYIVSSRFEGGPQAIIEAAAMRVPIISTDVGIASNILDKKSIIDIQIHNHEQPSKESIEHAYKNVLKINLKNHGNKFINLFKEII
tara:strand:+ start:280 stop:1203 length:924 start_codon:yes stop_codon:yes gene_type:complete